MDTDSNFRIPRKFPEKGDINYVPALHADDLGRFVVPPPTPTIMCSDGIRTTPEVAERIIRAWWESRLKVGRQIIYCEWRHEGGSWKGEYEDGWLKRVRIKDLWLDYMYRHWRVAGFVTYENFGRFFKLAVGGPVTKRRLRCREEDADGNMIGRPKRSYYAFGPRSEYK